MFSLPPLSHSLLKEIAIYFLLYVVVIKLCVSVSDSTGQNGSHNKSALDSCTRFFSPSLTLALNFSLSPSSKPFLYWSLIATQNNTVLFFFSCSKLFSGYSIDGSRDIRRKEARAGREREGERERERGGGRLLRSWWCCKWGNSSMTPSASAVKQRSINPQPDFARLTNGCQTSGTRQARPIHILQQRSEGGRETESGKMLRNCVILVE